MRRDHIQDSVNVHVGRKIRQRRWMVSMTQGELGQAIGVGLQQIHKYESGASQIGASRLWRIAAALGCDISYFFEDIDSGMARDAPLAKGSRSLTLPVPNSLTLG